VDIREFVTGSAQPKLNQGNMNKIMIPVPSIEEQDRIIGILDRFALLTTDLAVGLPAELNARRKQYEYYRDRLLTFDELVA
jgi:type I restriction enzyme S subunit